MANDSPSSSSSSRTMITEIDEESSLSLIPGLPNDLSAIILSFIPYPFHSRLKSICKSWRNFYASKTPLLLRQTIKSSLSHLLCVFPQDPSLSSPFLFDPTHLCWAPLPPMPINPHVYSLCNFGALSIGPHIYVLGGSLFDTRAFPMDRPVASSGVYRFDLGGGKWVRLASMITPRGSLAAAWGRGRIVVAGGGSRHSMFGAAGTRVGSAEWYDIERDEWEALEDMPGFRAGCTGFCAGKGREFWVMGGYGEARTINGVLPVDEYCKDAVVLELKSGGGRWREVGDMWGVEERTRLGKVVVIDDDDDDDGGGGGDGDGEKNVPGVFMLDGDDIFRYNMASNRWLKETTVPRKTQDGSPFGFVALQGELHVISLLQGVDLSEIRRSRHRRRGTVLFMQIYDPKKMSWRSLVTRTPFQCPLDFRTAVMCTIRV